jgi:hypothetical protein
MKHILLGLWVKVNLSPKALASIKWTQKCTSLMKHQVVVIHTVHQTEIPALLDSWITNTPSVKMFCPLPYIFIRTKRT